MSLEYIFYQRLCIRRWCMALRTGITCTGNFIFVEPLNGQFFKLTPDQAYREISDAKKLIEDIVGQSVAGHRAPAFSIRSTFLPYIRRTDSSRACSTNTPATSLARSLTGKTQPPFSNFVLRPRPEKYRRKSSLQNSYRLGRKNLPNSP